jgi:hypothetical protein
MFKRASSVKQDVVPSVKLQRKVLNAHHSEKVTPCEGITHITVHLVVLVIAVWSVCETGSWVQTWVWIVKRQTIFEDYANLALSFGLSSSGRNMLALLNEKTTIISVPVADVKRSEMPLCRPRFKFGRADTLG